MNLTIEKGIPLPEIPTTGRPASHDWSVLELGDSVIVPSARIARRGREWAARNGRKFVARKTPRGWRVWRQE
jgi:hypothetical protein